MAHLPDDLGPRRRHRRHDGKKVAFDDDSGLKALQTINRSAKDKSVYPDTKPGSETMYQIFNNDKMGMVPMGPLAAARLHRQQDRVRRVPLPTFNGNR